MIDDLRETLALYASDDIQIELTGPPIWTSEMLNAAVDDQIKFTIYGFSLGALIALSVAALVLGRADRGGDAVPRRDLGDGHHPALFGSFSFLTIIVTTIMLVIAFAESLFFVFNWLAYWRDGMDPYKAVDETVQAWSGRPAR